MSTGGILIPLVPLKEKEGFRLGKVLLEMKNITKTFPGVKALDNVNLQVEEGEIHALVGENGAGKSTLMNVLSGTYPYGTYEGDGATYQIWLEDSKSIAEKVKLIKKYKLAGVAEWKLGFENSGIWSVITENLS